MSYLYITDPGTAVKIKDRQISAEKKDGLKVFLPLEKLEGVVIIGNASLTSKCTTELLKRGLPVTYLSGSGLFYGRLESTRHINIERQRKQFRCGEQKKFRLVISKKIVPAKVHNQVVILRRYNRNLRDIEVQKIIEFMQIMVDKIERASSIEQIMGYEGIASKKYFEGISRLIERELGFKGRNRMPPKDPVNSLLSFGYTLLLYEIYTAIVNKGLHPYAAFLHKDRKGHPSLASDLIEEWRAVIVDSLVLKLFRKGSFIRDDFITKEKTGGVYLCRNKVKKFISEFETKLNTEVRYASISGSRMSFRRTIAYQANSLAKAIDSENPTLYYPIKVR